MLPMAALASCSTRHVSIEEARDLLERLTRLGRARLDGVLGVREALEYLQRRLDAGLAKFAVDAHGQAEKQIARARRQDRRRKPVQVAVDRRQHRILEIAAAGIEVGGILQVAVIRD